MEFGKGLGITVGAGIVAGFAFLVYMASNGNNAALVILGGLLGVLIIILACGLILFVFWVKDRMDARRGIEDHTQDVADLKVQLGLIKGIQATLNQQHAIFARERKMLPAGEVEEFNIEELLASDAIYEEIEE